ncbi:MAG: hypothetical protein CME26_03065 [Gemmatimonadetes bacterium]|nr:hypothetical protein [Gemmatimonadota bacterium]
MKTESLLVVNADDLGLHEDINHGVVEAHRRGIVTSSSIASCGRSFDHALDLLSSCPDLGVGVHLTLIEETPLSPLDQVRSLVGEEGRFHRDYRHFVSALVRGRIEPGHVRLELERQVKVLLDREITVGHLDSHQHVHVLPGVWHHVVSLAQQFGIPFVRIPRFDSVWSSNPAVSFARLGLNVWSCARRSTKGNLRSARFTPGLHLSGRLSRETLQGTVEGLRPGLNELVVHPGCTTPSLNDRYDWGYDWSGEKEALSSPEARASIEGNSVRLTNFTQMKGKCA